MIVYFLMINFRSISQIISQLTMMLMLLKNEDHENSISFMIDFMLLLALYIKYIGIIVFLIKKILNSLY